MEKFTLNHSTKCISVYEGCLLSDIMAHFIKMRLDMTDWTLKPITTIFTQNRPVIIKEGTNSDPYFNPPPTIYM